jgi:hypothetical protein
MQSLEKVAKLLLLKEVIFKEDLENILGKRPHGKISYEKDKENIPDMINA